MIWFWNGSFKNVGIFFVYLIFMNKSLVVILYMVFGLLEYVCIILCGYCKKLDLNCFNYWIIRRCNIEIFYNIKNIYIYEINIYFLVLK